VNSVWLLAGAVLISAFVSLSLTPCTEYILYKKGSYKTFMVLSLKQSPSFPGWKMVIESIAGFYESQVGCFCSLSVAVGIILVILRSIPSELAPLEDRNRVRTSITLPEGTDFDYTDKVAYNITQTLLDSIPEKYVVLTFAPGFGGGGSNAAFVSMGLVDASQRKRTQDQVAQQMTNMFRRLNNVRVFAVQEQTISVGTGGPRFFPCSICVAEFEF
jgi:HAE1 family hydrophobic/amphiphilic exporter-1/multidrug efflux pump